MKKLIAGLLLVLSPMVANAASISGNFSLYTDPGHTVHANTVLPNSTLFGLAQVFVSINDAPGSQETDAGLNRVSWQGLSIGAPTSVTLFDTGLIPATTAEGTASDLVVGPDAVQLAAPQSPLAPPGSPPGPAGAPTLSVIIEFAITLVDEINFGVVHAVLANLNVEYTVTSQAVGTGGDISFTQATFTEALSLVDTFQVPVPPLAALVGLFALGLLGRQRLLVRSQPA